MVLSDRQIDRQISKLDIQRQTDRMAIYGVLRTVRQIDRQIDIKIGYPETYGLKGIDMTLRQIDIDRYQNWISRDKQIEWQRYGVLRHLIDRQIDRQIDIKIRYPETNRLNGIDMVLSDRQIDRQIDIKIRYPEKNRLNGKHMVFSDSQIDRQIDIKIGYPETNRLNGIDMVLSDRQIDRQISKLYIQRQTD